MEYVITDKVIKEAGKTLAYHEGNIDAQIHRAIEIIIAASETDIFRSEWIEYLVGVDVCDDSMLRFYPKEFLETLPFNEEETVLSKAELIKKDLKEFLDKYNVNIEFDCHECSDLVGVYDEAIVVSDNKTNEQYIKHEGYSLDSSDLED